MQVKLVKEIAVKLPDQPYTALKVCECTYPIGWVTRVREIGVYLPLQPGDRAFYWLTGRATTKRMTDKLVGWLNAQA